MSDAVLTVVFVVLLLNMVAAVAVNVRQHRTGRWLLVTLITGTTGSALIVLLAVLTEADTSRFVDAALVSVGLTALTAAVRLVAGHRPDPEGSP